MKIMIGISLILSLFLFSCKDMMQETMDEKDHENGKYDSSKWDRAKWGE